EVCGSADAAPGGGGIMRTARHESMSEAPSRRPELSRFRKGLACENMRSELLLAFPQRISAKSAEVWHCMDWSRRRAWTRKSTIGTMRRARRTGQRRRRRRLVAAKI